MPGAGMGRAVSGVTRRDSSSADMFGSPVTAPVTRLPTRMLVVHRRVRTGASAESTSTNGRKHLESVLGSPQTCINSSSSDPRAHLISHDSENGSNISEEHNEERRRRLEMCTLSGGSGRKSRVYRGRPMRAYVNSVHTSIQGRRCQWLLVQRVEAPRYHRRSERRGIIDLSNISDCRATRLTNRRYTTAHHDQIHSTSDHGPLDFRISPAAVPRTTGARN